MRKQCYFKVVASLGLVRQTCYLDVKQLAQGDEAHGREGCNFALVLGDQNFFLYFEVQKHKKPSADVSNSLAEATNSNDPDGLSDNECQLSHD